MLLEFAGDDHLLNVTFLTLITRPSSYPGTFKPLSSSFVIRLASIIALSKRESSPLRASSRCYHKRPPPSIFSTA